MKNNTNIQGILSIAALVCLAVGWFNLLSPELNSLLRNQVFYVLIGASFFIQAKTLSDQRMLYPMYIVALLCIVGAFLPLDSRFASIKTIGLFGGVIISMFGRNRANN